MTIQKTVNKVVRIIYEIEDENYPFMDIMEFSEEDFALETDETIDAKIMEKYNAFVEVVSTPYEMTEEEKQAVLLRKQSEVAMLQDEITVLKLTT